LCVTIAAARQPRPTHTHTSGARTDEVVQPADGAARVRAQLGAHERLELRGLARAVHLLVLELDRRLARVLLHLHVPVHRGSSRSTRRGGGGGLGALADLAALGAIALERAQLAGHGQELRAELGRAQLGRVVLGGELDLAHDLRLLADFRAPVEAHHVHGQVRGEPREPRRLRVDCLSAERRRGLFDLLVERLRASSACAKEEREGGANGEDAGVHEVRGDRDVAVELERLVALRRRGLVSRFVALEPDAQ
jgi:hypothetical protein